MLKTPSQPHPMKILVKQLATGKANQDGRQIFGRVMRRKNVFVLLRTGAILSGDIFLL